MFVVDEEILMAEGGAVLRAAFADLPPRCQPLPSLLISDPPHPYAEISEKLRIPVESTGPRPAGGLDRLRRSSALISPDEGEAKINVRGDEPGA
jgi:hypothetical protein